jgi:TonB family protein
MLNILYKIKLPIITIVFIYGICFSIEPLDTLTNKPLKEENQISYEDSLFKIDSMPLLLNFVEAKYPQELIKKGIEGDVVLDLVIDTLGNVDSVFVVKGCHPVLDSNALEAAKKFKFRPAMASNFPVAVIMQYVYHFSIINSVQKVEKYKNFKGRIIERGTRTPVRDAIISVSFIDTSSDTSLPLPFSLYLQKIGSFENQHLEGKSIITISDSLGYFYFTSLPACSITVKVISPGYEQILETEVLKHEQAVEVTYHIQKFSYAENEMVIYYKVPKKEVAKYTLTLNEVKKIPGLSGDAVKVVQALPGVARSAFSSGSIIVRGAGAGDTRFLLDGVSLPLLFHFGGLKSTYNSDALSSVELYPGGFGTRYGGALAGIVEIKGREPKTDRLHGYLDGNLFDASFLVEGPITKNLSFLFTLRRSYIADVISFALKDILKQSIFLTAVPFYWDYILRTDYKPFDKHHFYLTLFGSKDKLDLIQSSVRGGSKDIDSASNALTSEQKFHMGILGWDYDVSSNLKNELRYAIVKYYTGVSAFGFAKIKGDMLYHHFRDQLSFMPANSLKLNFGLDLTIMPYDLILIIPNAENNITKDTSHYTFGPLGFYINSEYSIFDRLLLIPGIRFDYYPELKHKGTLFPEFWNYASFGNTQPTSVEPSLRISARYKITDNHSVKGSLGTYNQTPQPTGWAIHKTWGNPNLPAEKGAQYVLGHEWKITDLISSDLQVYYNRQWDNARMANASDLAKDPNNIQKYYSDGMARMYGLELMLKHDQSKRFFGWLAYSLSKSERYNHETQRWELYRKDETHNIQLLGSIRFAGNREFGARIRYVTGDPTTPILGVAYYDATNRIYVPQYGAPNSARVDPFFSIDVRYERKFIFKNWIWDIYLDIVNLSNLFGYGYKSPETGTYFWNYDYSEKQVISDVTRPALGIKFEF